MTRALVAVSLWFAAAAIAYSAVQSLYPDPCASHTGSARWPILGVSVLAMVAGYTSIPVAGLARRRIVAAVLGVGIGVAAGFSLYLIVLGVWVAHCAN